MICRASGLRRTEAVFERAAGPSTKRLRRVDTHVGISRLLRPFRSRIYLTAANAHPGGTACADSRLDAVACNDGPLAEGNV